MNKTVELNKKVVELASVPAKSPVHSKNYVGGQTFSAGSSNSMMVEKYLRKLDWKIKEN